MPLRGRGTELFSERQDGPPWRNLMVWGGFIFVIWGLPAIGAGTTTAIIVWLVFLLAFVVPHTVHSLVRRRRSHGRFGAIGHGHGRGT